MTRLWLSVGLCALVACGAEGQSQSKQLVEPLPDISSHFGGDTGATAADTGARSQDTGGTASDTSVAVDSGALTDVNRGQDTGSSTDTGPSTDTGSSTDTGAIDTSTGQDGGATDTVIPCGDNKCEGNETCSSCPADCGFCPKECGNKTCDSDEHCKNCPEDCGACPAGCGDGKCDGSSENCQSCSLDCGKCPAMCGDKSCNGQETCTSCPVDCGVCPGGCGDGQCDATKENCQNCSADCGQCPGLCEPLTSKGCPANQQCYPTSTSAACGNPGTGSEHSPCTGATNCAKGMLCVGSVCKKLCDSSGTDSNYSCAEGKCGALTYSDGKPVGFNLGSCTVYGKCNALTNVGCATNQNCDVVKEGTLCIAHGNVGEGQGCKSLSDCMKGFMCIGNPMVCLKKCSTTGGTPSCGGGKQCITVTIGDPGVPAPNNLGVCN